MYLLDSVAFLGWIGEGSKEVKGRTRELIQSGAVCYLSVTSIWEMVIKVGKGLLILPMPLEELVPAKMSQFDFPLLPLDLPSLFRVQHLPFHHKDPFDRLLIAQAIEHNLQIVSSDEVFDRYGIARIWD